MDTGILKRDTPRIRLANGADAELILAWRNDPWLVSLSTNRRTVTEEEHRAWFATVLDESRHLLFVVESPNNVPAGTVRLDRLNATDAVMTIYLLRPFTGQGFGPQALEVACVAAFERWPWLRQVVAYVRSDNQPSLKAFARAGFALCPTTVLVQEGHTGLCRAREAALPAWGADDDQTIHRYTQLIEQYGVGPNALDWGSRESQELRFKILSAVAPLGDSEVLDLGCGQGDFFCWLDREGINVRYRGVDITPGMIEIAQRRFPLAHFDIRNALIDPLGGPYDYVVASGLFAYRQTDPMEFLRRSVAVMYRSARFAVAFNCLSDWGTDKVVGEFYADPLAVVRLCREFSPWIILRHDYHPRDFTIYLYKNGNRR